jgi:hypothetical protein
MLMMILGAPMGLFGLIFALFQLAHWRRATGRQAISPSQAVVAKDATVVGVVQPIETPGKSPITDEEVVWLRALQTAKGVFRSKSGKTFYRSRVGKHRSRFALVDEQNPNLRLIINSNRISDLWVLLKTRRYRMDCTPLDTTADSPGAVQAVTSLLRFHLIERRGVQEQAIHPGDRIWAHGRIREKDGELVLYGYSAWLDDRAPADRAAYCGNLARIGGLIAATGALATLIGWLFS